MPRNYKKVRTSEVPSEDTIKQAVFAVRLKQLTIRAAAEKYNLTKSTVGFYCVKETLQYITRKDKPLKRTQHNTQIFTLQQEQELTAYLKTCSLLNHGLTPNETRKVAHQYAVANNVKCPQNWNVRKEASRDWFTGFLKRNKTLSIRKPEATSQARAAGFNRPVVNQFYSNLLALLMKYDFLPCDIWNCDETNVPTVVQPPDVIATKGLKQVRGKNRVIKHIIIYFTWVSQTVSAERGVNVTMLCFINATGSSTPPVFVFPRKRVPCVYSSKEDHQGVLDLSTSLVG